MKRIKLILLTAAMVLAMTITAYAAFSANVSFSDPTANVGEEVTVSMKIRSTGGNLGSAKIMLNYDPAFLEFTGGDNAEGGAGTVKVSGDSSLGKDEWAYKLKFRALSPGTTTITMDDSWEIYDDSQNMATLDHKGSSAVTINGDVNSSINANLSSLKISPGVLVPDFSPEQTQYTTLVGGDCNKLTVSAATADSNAKVIISGNADLQLGENVVTCQVTAQDGTTKDYVITVTKQEGEVDYGQSSGILQANVNGNDYEVAETFDETMLPSGFTAQTVEYKGQTVMAGVNEAGLTLMYLIGSDGSGDFFVYDVSNDQWSPFAQITTLEKTITVVPLTSDVTVPEGFAETTLELSGKKIQGWIWSADIEQQYCMVYGMNADGEKNFYRYDLKEKTIQRFFSNPVSKDTEYEEKYVELGDKYNELVKDFTLRGYIMLGLGIIAGILLIALIIVLITSRGNDYNDEGPKRKSKKQAEEESRLAEERQRRARERELRRQKQERASRHYDEAEERYMRGDEEDEGYTDSAVHPSEALYAEERRMEAVEEEKLQRSLAREIQRSTEKAEEKPVKLPEPEDDGFETFEI